MSGFTPVFGTGGVIYPAQQTQINLALTANTILQWPLEQQVGGSNIAAAIVSVTASAGPLAITLSSAELVSNGYAILFDNVAANSFTVKDAGGNTLLTVASGEAWVLYLRDNSTVNGTWRSFQQGAGASSANAATLAGAGLKAISTTLNEQMLPTAHGVNYAVALADRATVQMWTGGVGAFTLPNPATVGTGWFVTLKNAGNGNLTITPVAGDIDGSASVVIAPERAFIVYTDGADYFTVGSGGSQITYPLTPQDGDKIIFGTGGDIEEFFDGADFYLEKSTPGIVNSIRIGSIAGVAPAIDIGNLGVNVNVGVRKLYTSSLAGAVGGGALNFGAGTAAAAGVGGGVALPATPEGYLMWNLNGTPIKIPYYLT
jgi:hypothetical protein